MRLASLIFRFIGWIFILLAAVRLASGLLEGSIDDPFTVFVPLVFGGVFLGIGGQMGRPRDELPPE